MIQDIEEVMITSWKQNKVNSQIDEFNDAIIHSIIVKSVIKTKNNIVLIHGYNGSASSFQYIVNFLSLFFNVYLINLPGFGISIYKNDIKIQNITLTDIITSYVNLIRKYIEKHNLKKNTTIIGHSFGSYLAVEYCNRYKTDKLILISPVGILPCANNWMYLMFIFYKYCNINKLLRGYTLLVKVLKYYYLSLFGSTFDLKLQNKTNISDIIIEKLITINKSECYITNPILCKILQLKCKVGIIYSLNDTYVHELEPILIYNLSNKRIPCFFVPTSHNIKSKKDSYTICSTIFKAYNQAQNIGKITTKKLNYINIILSKCKSFLNPFYTKYSLHSLYERLLKYN